MQQTISQQQSDDFYAALIDAHRDLAPDESETLNARLILLMAEAIGDNNKVLQIIELAKQSAKTPENTKKALKS